MGKIRIVRSNQYLNKRNNFKIMLNGQYIGSLASAEIQEYEVELGKNNLNVKVDWSVYRSNEIDFQVEENETKTFNVCINKNINYLTFCNFFVLLTHYALVSLYDFYYFLWLAIPVVVLMYVYYFTLGRDKYLVLSEA